MSVLTVVLLATSPALAQREIDRFVKKKRKPRPDPVFVDLSLGWSGTYRPGRWVPLYLMIDPPDKPVGGVLTLDVPQDSFHRMVLEQDYALTPGSQLQLVIYGQLGTMDDLHLTLRDQRGRRRLVRPISSTELPPNLVGELSVAGVVGDRATIDARQRTNAVSGSDNPRWVARWEAEARLPRSWVGYDVLDCLVLANPNWSLIAPEAGEAIAQWVERGGRLLIYGSEPPPADHPVRGLLPLDFGDPKRVEVSQAVTLKIGSRFSTGTSAVVSNLALRPSAMAWSTLRDGETHYVAGGPVGFGWVNYLSVHPTDLIAGSDGEPENRGQDLGEAKRFVGQLIDRTLDHTLADPVPVSLFSQRQNNNLNNQQWYGSMGSPGGPGEMAASRVLNALSQIQGIGPISFLWIGGLLTSLLVLLGPVDYFALRRLGRLPWTWYTVTGYIILFSGIGFWIAHTRRLGTTQVRRASVVDSVQGNPTAHQSGVTVVYASRSGGYQPQDLRSDRWWSAYLPRNEFRFGMNEFRAGTQQVFYRQSAGCEITRLPIPVANIRCLRDQSTTEPLDVVLRRSKDGSGYELLNRSTEAIMNGMLFELEGLQLRSSQFNRVEPGTTATIAEPHQAVNNTNPLLKEPNPEGYSNYYYSQQEISATPNVPRYALARLGDAHGRTGGVYAWLRSGAVLLWAEVHPPLDFSLKDHQTQDFHLQLHRLVIPREHLEGANQAAAPQPRKDPPS